MSEDVAFNILMNKISIKTGLDFSKYKGEYIKRRISGRMKMKGISSYAQYLRYLENNSDEYSHIMDSIAINVTEFFRDPSTFLAFKNEVMPVVLREKMRRRRRRGVHATADWDSIQQSAAKSGNASTINRISDSIGARGVNGVEWDEEDEESMGFPRSTAENRIKGGKLGVLRIWSAGCASGEEPYTIAIILLEELGARIDDFLVSVLGTDIDEDALKKAIE